MQAYGEGAYDKPLYHKLRYHQPAHHEGAYHEPAYDPTAGGRGGGYVASNDLSLVDCYGTPPFSCPTFQGHTSPHSLDPPPGLWPRWRAYFPGVSVNTGLSRDSLIS